MINALAYLMCAVGGAIVAIGALVARLFSLLCRVRGHRITEEWRSGIQTTDHLELVLNRCRRCRWGRWEMASRVPDALIIE